MVFHSVSVKNRGWGSFLNFTYLLNFTNSLYVTKVYDDPLYLPLVETSVKQKFELSRFNLRGIALIIRSSHHYHSLMVSCISFYTFIFLSQFHPKIVNCYRRHLFVYHDDKIMEWNRKFENLVSSDKASLELNK